MKLDKSKPSPDQTPPQHKLFFADANNGLYELFHVNDNADNDFVMNNLFPMDIIEFMNYYGLVAGKRTMSVLYDLRKEA
jgi:hypothetical protein